MTWRSTNCSSDSFLTSVSGIYGGWILTTGALTWSPSCSRWGCVTYATVHVQASQSISDFDVGGSSFLSPKRCG